jgi:dihydroorotase
MALLVTPLSAKQFSDVVVMPNLNPPISSVQKALDYRDELLSYAKCNYHMALYLTENTTIDDVITASYNSHIIGFKLYPLNATTGSENGVSDIKKLYTLFEKMQDLGVPLLIHGEVTRPGVDIFAREKVFIKEILKPLVNKFPNLKITLEHITTEYAVNFVNETKNVVATITAHHLFINRSDIFKVGEKTALNPHNFCLPVAKRENDRIALLKAATSGNPKFFAGSDSAPHPLNGKLSNCGCAGCFTGLHAVELYMTAFDSVDETKMLEGFLSIFGRNHYDIEIPDEKITILNKDFTLPDYIGENIKLTPFMYGETLSWKVLEE